MVARGSNFPARLRPSEFPIQMSLLLTAAAVLQDQRSINDTLGELGDQRDAVYRIEGSRRFRKKGPVGFLSRNAVRTFCCTYRYYCTTDKSYFATLFWATSGRAGWQARRKHACNTQDLSNCLTNYNTCIPKQTVRSGDHSSCKSVLRATDGVALNEPPHTLTRRGTLTSIGVR